MGEPTRSAGQIARIARIRSKIEGKLRGTGGRVTRRIGHFNYTRERRCAYDTVSLLREMQDELKR